MDSKANGNSSKGQLSKVLGLFIVVLLPWFLTYLIIENRKEEKTVPVRLENKHCDKKIPAFHTKFDELRGPFTSARDVTAACLGCHTERHREILKSVHWNWEKEDLRNGSTSIYLGKRTAINNFCLGTQGSEQTCMRCHIGFGWKDKSFDFADANSIDCLVCHDRTDTYRKESGEAGWPKTSVDLAFVAQRVCVPRKENCGVCHFWGGGGNNVKHGDLEKALLNCSRDVDVHMAKEGLDLACVDCHITVNHNITGRSYGNSFSNSNRVSCEQCHGAAPHTDKLLNRHNQKVACQTCHIPTYAKVNATKTYWDWTTAGRLDENGKEITEHDNEGNHTYLSIKGSFEWGKNLEPEYVWFNGTADHYLLGEKISGSPLKMNPFNGMYSCPESKIVPVKIHRGKQIFDPVTNMLIQPKLFSKNKGEGAYWVDFNWDTACAVGMANIGLPYSGKYDWIETEMYMNLNHMVAPKEMSLSCKECHAREGRLTQLSGFYLVGRDRSKVLDLAGIALILVAAGVVFIHALMRYFVAKP
jgi:octaheme c-type cytochrome (tetrathionate reductase family)